jgi:general L-amino acid transport system permease protein
VTLAGERLLVPLADLNITTRVYTVAFQAAMTGRTELKTWIAPGPRRLRGWLYQASLVLLLLLVAVLALQNLGDNLAKRGISLGFGFLSQKAGFDIGFSVIPFTEADTYWRVFVVGVTNTLLAATLGIVFATFFGFVIGVARLSPNWSVSRLALAYVELIRNLPLLLHVLIWYNLVVRTMPPPRAGISVADLAFFTNRGLYLPAASISSGWLILAAILLAAAITALWGYFGRVHQNRTGHRLPVVATSAGILVIIPLLAGLAVGAKVQLDLPRLQGFNFAGGFAVAPELVALVAALAIYNASFIAELVRASIESVGRGQRDASAALGLRRGQILRLVIIPQAFRVLIPPLSNQYLHLLKASSLATVIGYPDLVNVFTGTALNQTGRAVEIVLMTMAVYLAISAAIALACGAFNHMTRIIER